MKQLPEETIEAMQATAITKQRPCVVQLNGNELRCVTRKGKPHSTFFLYNGVLLDEMRATFTLAGFNAAHPTAAKDILNALKAEL